jgi:hypothetical protein
MSFPSKNLPDFSGANVSGTPTREARAQFRVDACWDPGNYAKSFWFDSLREADAWIAARTLNCTYPWPDGSEGALLGPYEVTFPGGKRTSRIAHPEPKPDAAKLQSLLRGLSTVLRDADRPVGRKVTRPGSKNA